MARKNFIVATEDLSLRSRKSSFKHWLRVSAFALLGASSAALAGDREECASLISPRSIEACRRLSDQGDAIAQYNLGLYHLYNPSKSAAVEDTLKGYMLIKKAAENGHIGAWARLGEMISGGVISGGTAANAREHFARGAALALREQGYCDLNCLASIRYMAMAYESGYGGPANKARAAELFGVYLTRLAKALGDSQTYAPILPSRYHLRALPYFQKNIRFNRISLFHMKHQISPSCRVWPAKSPAFWPESKPGVRYEKEFDLTLQIQSDLTYSESGLRTALQKTAEVFAECGVRLRKVDFAVHSSQCSTQDLSATYKTKVVAKLGRSDTSIAQGGTPRGWNAVEFSGIGNYLEDASRTLTHELGHLLGDMDHPHTFDPSIMQYGILEVLEPKFTPTECSWIRESRLVYPVSSARSDADIRVQPKPEFLNQGMRDMETYFNNVGDQFPRSPALRLFYAWYAYQEELNPPNPFNHELLMNFMGTVQGMNFSVNDMLKVYEFYHNWRPENGWPNERTDFKLKTPLNLYWLPGYRP